MKWAFLFILFISGSVGFAAVSDSTLITSVKRKPTTDPPPVHENRFEPSYFDTYVKPKSVEGLISYCATQWMQEEKDSFAAMPEAVAVRHHHYWYDTWINKMWGILVNDSGVTANFKMYGITDNEDKWRIILTSLHRRLNHQDADIPGQVREIKKKKKKS